MDAPQVALLFTNAGGADIERLRWHAEFIVRAAPGEGSRVVAASPPLTTPFVIYGRMLQPYWMKLERRGHSYIGSISPDGNTWTEVGKAEAALQGTLVVGMSACSSLGAVTTRIMYDHISAPGWIMPQLRSQK